MLDINPAIVPFSALIAAISGVWVLMGSIRKQFDVSRTESEARASRTYARIDDLRAHMDENFVNIRVCDATTGRLHDALMEHDRQMSDLNNRLNCPAARGTKGG